MPRGIKKESLPTKICLVCNRPFTWRKKWERCWDEVTTCSKSCNGLRKGAKELADRMKNDSIQSSTEDEAAEGVDRSRLERRAAAKAAKALARAKREGSGPLSAGIGQKVCNLCLNSVNLLVRCQTDSTRIWRMVCDKCWKVVSGGVADGDGNHPYYRYGGLWKNRKALVPRLDAHTDISPTTLTSQFESEQPIIENMVTT